ncbi:MAG: hypothetical protein N2692_01655 [Patescibacteria group bacterium]|jgi:hypothetical protein|nr:hypothetical protein [Patescibacteria group bacterium]
MAEFQNIDLYAKKRSGGWLGRLLTLSIILLIISLGLYFIAVFYQNYLNKNISDLNNKIKSLSNEISETDRREVLGFYSQLINLKALLSNHLYSSKIFERLELITHPKVAFSAFSYDYKNKTLKIDGYSNNLEFLAQQMLAFQKVSEFNKVNLSNVRIAGDKVTFAFEITFNPNFVLK